MSKLLSNFSSLLRHMFVIYLIFRPLQESSKVAFVIATIAEILASPAI